MLKDFYQWTTLAMLVLAAVAMFANRYDIASCFIGYAIFFRMGSANAS